MLVSRDNIVEESSRKPPFKSTEKCFEEFCFQCPQRKQRPQFKKDQQQEETKMILAPEPFDVLFGRGKPIQKRPGNKLLRLLIDQNSQRYNRAPRLEKRAIANEIVQGIKSNNGKFPGRFLRLCGSTEQQGWKQVSDAVAIDKVSHCFRARRKNLETVSRLSRDSLEIIKENLETLSRLSRDN
jgi:hypothetical protein